MAIPQVATQRNNRKFYGQAVGGFTNGMNSSPFAGVGFQLLQNLEIENGEVTKVFGESLLATIASISELIQLEEYQKVDGTFQILAFYYDGANYKMRAIEEDGTITTPTGGAGDVNFTNTSFGYAQITTTGYISTKLASTAGLYSWDGVALTAITTGTPQNITALGVHGRRLVAIAEGVVYGSMDANPITAFTGGANELINIEFRTNSSSLPVGAYNSNIGTVIGFTNGFELHNVTPVADGVGGLIINSETRERLFQYNGSGLMNAGLFVYGAYYGYALTDVGLIRIDPQSGQSVNLFGEEGKDKAGAINNYFKQFNITDAQIGYDQKQKMIVFCCSSTDTGLNDIIVMLNEQTGNFSLRTGFYKTIKSINGTLYGGSSVSGRITKIFDKTKYADFDGNRIKTRAVSEWDVLDTMQRFKLSLDYFAFVSTYSESTVTINLYIDGDIDTPVATNTYTPSDKTDTSFVSGVLGDLTLGIGTADDTENSDLTTKAIFNTRFHSYCWEIIEESTENFIIRDFQLESIQQEDVSGETSYSNKLPTI